ncbi:MAG: Rieske 2Fe-2S domain-containing protein [Actinomycetota bacterium]|nr:Rieske 2Fe-2S domain-containing protein [Actinomycetota bacterium]
MLRQLLQKIESTPALDAVGKKVSGAVSAVVSPTPLKNLLNGVWLGHPAHPLLTDLPIGSWTSAAVLDVFGGRRASPGADALIGFGVAAALPTVATGAADWVDYNEERVRRVGIVHATANSVALAFYTASLVARRRGRRATGVALSFVGLGAVAAGGYLGGHLAYRLASGVDRTTFDDGPHDWQDVLASASLVEGQPRRVDAAGVPVVLVAQQGGIRALHARCSHMGGPLDQGEVDDGCIRCPWHASTFRLGDGSVARAPATAPQPVFETRVLDGRVQVRAAPGRTAS